MFGGPSVPGFFPPAICANVIRLGTVVLPYHRPSEQEPPCPDGRFHALAFRLLEGLGVRKVGVIDTALETNESPKDLEVRLSKLVIVNRVEGPR